MRRDHVSHQDRHHARGVMGTRLEQPLSPTDELRLAEAVADAIRQAENRGAAKALRNEARRHEGEEYGRLLALADFYDGVDRAISRVRAYEESVAKCSQCDGAGRNQTRRIGDYCPSIEDCRACDGSGRAR
jgi:DnaJ-class molecular chaperone